MPTGARHAYPRGHGPTPVYVRAQFDARSVGPMSDDENTPIQAVWDAMLRSVDMYSGPLTDIQTTAVLQSVANVIGGAPDAFYGIYSNQGKPGDVVYTFYWVKGGAFGCSEVLRTQEMESGPPVTRGWVRPLSKIERVDFDSMAVSNQHDFRSGVTVKLKVAVRWDSDAAPDVVLDATGSMNTYSRPELEKLIRLVLDRIS